MISILKELLVQALTADMENEKIIIKKIQNAIWDDKSIQNESLNNILSEIAQDLDYYEPDDQKREEDSSYYGIERLKDELREALEKISHFPEENTNHQE